MENTTENNVAFLGLRRKLPPPIIMEALEDKEFRKTYEFPEAEMERVHKVMVTCDIPAQGFYRARFGLAIGGIEVFPNEMELRCVMTGEDCPPEQRYITIDRMRGTGKIDVFLKDTDHPEAVFEPYQIAIYLIYDLKKEQSV
jgi:hypothetical protein